MSYDLIVDLNAPINLAGWRGAVAGLGVEVDFEPSFVPVAHEGPVTVKLKIGNTAWFYGAERIRPLGELVAGFEYHMGSVPAQTPQDDLDERLEVLKWQQARLRRVSVPGAVLSDLEHQVAETERVRDGGEPDRAPRITLAVPWASGAPDYVAAIHCAGGLALATQGSFSDPQAKGGPYKGPDVCRGVLEAVEHILKPRPEAFERDHRPFTSWEEVAPEPQ